MYIDILGNLCCRVHIHTGNLLLSVSLSVVYTYIVCAERLHVEYAGERIKHGIIFMISLFYDYSNLAYVHIHAIYRVHQAEYGIRILVAASQEYVNTYSTRRVPRRPFSG